MSKKTKQPAGAVKKPAKKESKVKSEKPGTAEQQEKPDHEHLMKGNQPNR